MRLLVRAGLIGGALAVSAAYSSAALAAQGDKVAVLPFIASGGGTTSAELDAARAATRGAVVQMHDELPGDAEMATAEHEVKDGVADTSAEYRAAGRTAKAQWTVAGHVDVHGATYRLEIDACEIATGRVESLAREIDPRQAAPQIAEMLTLLLRTQGVGDTVPPWDQPTAPAPTTAPSATPRAVVLPPPGPAPDLPPPSPRPPPPAYAENYPYALGLGGEGLTAFSRAANARGSAVAGLVTVNGGYALEGIRGLELVANVAVSVAGPSSLWLDAGLRYELPIIPKARIFAGPEVDVGAFVGLGGDKDARFLVRGALPISVGIGERVQVEAYPQIAYAAGGTAGLAFAGGGLRVAVRF